MLALGAGSIELGIPPLHLQDILSYLHTIDPTRWAMATMELAKGR